MLPSSNAIILPDEERLRFNHQLIQAVKEGDYDLVESLITQGADVDAQDHLNNTSLHIAAEKGDSKLFQVLIRHKAYVNAQNHRNDTPSHYAAKKRRSHLLRSLLKHKANVNLQNRYDETPLHYAAQEGHSRAVKILMNHKADVNLRNHRDDAPLHNAARKGYSKVVKILLNKTDVNAQGLDGKTSLHYAAQEGHSKVAKMLIDRNAKVDARCLVSGLTVLHYLVESLSEDLSQVSRILPNSELQVTDRLHANSEGSLRLFTDFLKILLEKDINPNIPNCNEETSLQLLYKKYNSDLKPLLSQYTYRPMPKIFQAFKASIIALTVKAYICGGDVEQYIEIIPELKNAISAVYITTSAAKLWMPGSAQKLEVQSALLENAPDLNSLDNSKVIELLGGTETDIYNPDSVSE